ncbi:MAG: DUF2029 domain-containing protein [Anaerolineae bacterium]|nr:DUF2029 domain-containing protein [Anaerolineae bacterium]
MNLTTRRKNLIILMPLFVVIVAMMAIPSYQLLVKARGQAFDLFWIWAGGQAILRGENPYGPDTTRVIQLGVFKKIIPPHQYQHGFPHPAHIAFVLLPFAALPFFWSIIIWLSLQIPLFMVILLLGFDLLKWPVRPLWLFALTMLALLGFRYPINAYVVGQLTFFIIFCFVLSAWFFKENHPRWSAVALACATIRPDLALLAILTALFLIRRSPRRVAFMTTLLITGLIFFILPAMFIGFWPLIWLQALQSYGANPFATWPPGLLPALWLRVGLLLLLAAWAGRYIFLAWQQPNLKHNCFMTSAIILFGLMVLPQTGSYNLTFCLIPAFILIRYTRSKWLRVIIAASLLMPWFYFALNEPFDVLIFLLIPGQFILFQEVVQVLDNRHPAERPTESTYSSARI